MALTAIGDFCCAQLGSEQNVAENGRKCGYMLNF